MSIYFEKVKDTLKFMNPFKDFTLDEIPFEIRYDPLTGQTTRVYDLPYKPVQRPDFEELVRRSLKNPCPFCPGSIEKSTPLYPPEIIPQGRVSVGEACLVPNLLPLDRYTGVCVISHDHFIAIEDFTPEILRDAFKAARIFLNMIAERDSSVKYFNINWNYMTPAGSSMVHPHIQVNCGRVPTYQHRLQIESSLKYFNRNGNTFWDDYIDAEQEADERFLLNMGPSSWTLSFAPHGALPDFWCIFPSHSSLLQIDDNDFEPFLEGLVKSIRHFDTEGLYSFNFSLFSCRENDHFRVNARVSPRLLLREIGNSDQTYYQVLHREPCTIRPPESVREKVLELFRN